MITETTIFKNLIGQDEVKRQLSFYADAQNKTGVAPFLMLSGQRAWARLSSPSSMLMLSRTKMGASVHSLRSTAPPSRTPTLSLSRYFCLS